MEKWKMDEKDEQIIPITSEFNRIRTLIELDPYIETAMEILFGE